jgi:hypothetical protein
MIRALLLILDAGASWEKIARAQRGFLFILCVHLLPLLVFTLGVEAYAMTRLGESRTIAGDLVIVTRHTALRYALGALVINVVVILAGARLVELIGRSFHFPTSYRACFTLLAYGLSPLFLLHLLDALPAINTWVCFAIGIALSVAALYLGTPVILRPDPAKAMGIYMIVSLMLILLAALGHFLAQELLHNRLNLRFWEQFLR